MANTPPWGRYAELRPEQLEAIMAVAPVAYVPWGALEWHGPHLPLGLDGFTAEGVAERDVQRTGGVLLPTTWWPITALPHRYSLSIGSADAGNRAAGRRCGCAAAPRQPRCPTRAVHPPSRGLSAVCRSLLPRVVGGGDC